MRKLYYYDNVHQRRRKQQLIDCNNREYCGDSNGKSRRYKEIGAVLSKYAATKNGIRDDIFHSHSHTDHNEQPQQKPLNQLTKCAKMSEENGMIKNGNLNGVGIAKSISQNLTNFSSFTISPSTTTTPPPPTTTTTTASASSSTLSTIGTSNSLANSISNSNNSVRANNESTANVTSPPNGLNGGGGGGGGGNVVDPSNGDCGDQKPTNNNNGNIGAYPNALGGRLQFFKDGKFILELARSKEGDRSGWVSVPRKTYWPPAAPSSNNNSVNHNKNESSTSLSFSDDNSSIQSSPWQRDHCWKQPSPRRNISKELCLYYARPTAIVLHAKCLRISKLKSRRPHDTRLSANQRVEYAKRTISKTSTSTKIEKTKVTVEVMEATRNEEETNVDTVDSKESSVKLNEKIKEEGVDEKKSSTTRIKADAQNSDGILPTKQTILRRPKLNDILQKLIDNLAEQPQSVVGMQAGPGAGALLSGGNGTSRTSDLNYYQQHVSPRKRILREFEKVSLEDAANTSSSTKRSRSKGCASLTASSDASRAANGSRNTSASLDGSPKTTQSSTLYPISQSNVAPATSRPISSYSITSLLGHNSSSSSSVTNPIPKLDNGQRTSPKSPQQPSIGRLPKKRSPINGSASVGSPLGLSSSSFSSHRSPMNSPVNHGGRSTRSPDVNSPSPDHHHSMRSHAQRYALGGTTTSISSPSGFHPYLPTSRASPLSDSAATESMHKQTLPRFTATEMDHHQPPPPPPQRPGQNSTKIYPLSYGLEDLGPNSPANAYGRIRPPSSSASPPPPPPLPSSTQPSSLHPLYLPYGAPSTHQSMAAMAAAAYLNPMYYHPMTYSNPFRSQFWMPYPTAPNSNPIRSPSEPSPFPVRSLSVPRPFHGHSPPADAPSNSIATSSWLHSSSVSPPKTTFQRQASRTGRDYDSYQSIREDHNSDVPLNLSKH